MDVSCFIDIRTKSPFANSSASLKVGLSYSRHSLGWTCTKLAIWPFPHVNLMVCCRWLGTPRCCFILSLSNGTLWFLLLTSSSCCKTPKIEVWIFCLTSFFWGCEDRIIHAVLHILLKKTNKQKNSLTFVKFIIIIIILNICVWMYVYMWGICTHSHICVCILGLYWCLVLHVDCSFCLFKC